MRFEKHGVDRGEWRQRDEGCGGERDEGGEERKGDEK